MKFTLPSLLAIAVLAGSFCYPVPAHAESNEEKAIRKVQLDIYDLARTVNELKSAQDGRTAQLETLLHQVIQANAALTAELKGLHEAVRKNETDLQTKVIEPLSGMKLGLDDVSREAAGLQASISTLRSQQSETGKTVDDMYVAIKVILKQTENLQPPAPVSVVPSGADAVALLFASAERDKLAGKLPFALQTFLDLSQNYPNAPEAPMAVYEMGSMYAANGQYDQALIAFDRVLEQFPDNPMRKDAQFRKAEQLESLGKRADAAKEFDSFAKQYPGDEKTPVALARSKDLRAPAPAKAKIKGK